MGVNKTIEHIQIKIKMSNPSWEHPASAKSSNQGLKDMVVLFTLKVKIESPNWEHGCVKGVNKTIDHIQIKIRMPNPSQNVQHPPKLQIRT